MRLFKKIGAGLCGIFLAYNLLDGVKISLLPGKSGFLGIVFTKEWQIVLMLGICLGLINYFVKPILNLLSFPLRILSFGLFSLLLNMFLVWLLDFIFVELEIEGFKNLFLATVLIWASDTLLTK